MSFIGYADAIAWCFVSLLMLPPCDSTQCTTGGARNMRSRRACDDALGREGGGFNPGFQVLQRARENMS